jgi:GNAT superfamily N-acetyltransferase
LSITIREAEIGADGDRIAKALISYLTPRADQARFDWLYKRNPQGQVRVWLAIDEGHELVGTAAAFPRRLYIGQEEKTGWVFGDFCVSDRHRSLGPAVALQRALLEAADSNGISVSYDFPSTAMTAVYKRLKIEPMAQMVRMAKILRVDREVHKRLGNTPPAKVLSSIGNVFLQVTSSRSRVDRNIKMCLLESKCGLEFDALAERLGARFGLCVYRSSDYLNWRYLENPYKTHQLMTAKRDGSLLGFAVLSQSDADGEIVDIFGEDSFGLPGLLIGEIVELFRGRGASTVSIELMESHAWMELFKKFGFYPREHKPLVVYNPREACLPSVGSNSKASQSSWFITGGDRDS